MAKALKLILLISILISCKAKNVKHATKIDSVAYTDVKIASNYLMLDTSKIITHAKIYAEILNDSGKVVQRVFRFEVKHENKALEIKDKKMTEISEKTSVNISRVASEKNKTSMLHWGVGLVLIGGIWIFFRLKNMI